MPSNVHAVTYDTNPAALCKSAGPRRVRRYFTQRRKLLQDYSFWPHNTKCHYHARMLTRDDLKAQIELHIEGFLPLEDLAAWAEDVFRDEEFEEPFVEQISDFLSTLRDAVDPHRFRWEEPDFEQMLEELND